jgi:hypothetical protein
MQMCSSALTVIVGPFASDQVHNQKDDKYEANKATDGTANNCRYIALNNEQETQNYIIIQLSSKRII